MSLKIKYWLSVGLLLLVLAFLVYKLLAHHWLFFVLGEIFLIASLILAFLLYQQLIAPLQFISAGIDAIKSQDFQVKYLPVGFKEMDLLINTYNEMIEQLRNERILNSEQHYFLQKLIEEIPTGIILLDFDEQVRSSNEAATEFLQFASQSDYLLKDLMQLPVGENRILMVSGTKKYKIEAASFVHLGFNRRYFIIHDLTVDLLENEKQSYGKVIRMMAHEVNNTVAPVNSIMDSVAAHFDEKNIDLIESLQVAQQRNNELNLFMRNFADLVRLPEPRLVDMNLGQLCQEVVKLYSAILASDGIQIDYIEAPQKSLVNGDPVLLRQVLINILKNAHESILEKGNQEGKIEVRLSSQPSILEVRDTGVGINQEIQHQIFSTFFSTKEKGQGIGLTLIRDILLKHPVRFDLVTKGGWTTFRIEFV